MRPIARDMIGSKVQNIFVYRTLYTLSKMFSKMGKRFTYAFHTSIRPSPLYIIRLIRTIIAREIQRYANKT